MTDTPCFVSQNLDDAHEASVVCAINGIASLANILCKRGLVTNSDVSALYESMCLPLNLPKYADNSAVQDLQSNLDLLFAVVVEPEQPNRD